MQAASNDHEMITILRNTNKKERKTWKLKDAIANIGIQYVLRIATYVGRGQLGTDTDAEHEIMKLFLKLGWASEDFMFEDFRLYCITWYVSVNNLK